MTFFRKLHRIIQQRHQHHFQPLPGCIKGHNAGSRHIFQFNSRLQFRTEALNTFLATRIHFYLLPRHLPHSRIHIRNIEYVLHQTQQICIVALHLFNILAFLHIIQLLLSQQGRKADDGIQRSTDFMGDMLYKGTFDLAHFFHRPACSFQLAVHGEGADIQISNEQQKQQYQSANSQGYHQSFLVQSGTQLQLLHLQPVHLKLCRIFA